MKHVMFSVLAMFASGVTSGHATQIFDNTVSSCTAADCSSLTIPGTINGNGTSSAGPWTAELFASTNECIRLFVVSQNVDTEIVAVRPDGFIYRNDDGGGSNRPLVKINGTVRGWHTVQVSHFAGSAVESDFVLLYGRYNLNNPNCSSPTPPQNPTAAAAVNKSGTTGPRVTGGPSER